MAGRVCVTLIPLPRCAFFTVLQARSISVSGVKGTMKLSFDRPLPPKSPPSAYIRFVKENLHKLPSELAPKEKIKTIAVQWKSLAEEDKARYVSEYEAAKEEYKKDLDEFLQNVDEEYVKAYEKFKKKKQYYKGIIQSKRKGGYVKRKLTAYSVFTSENFKEIYAKQPEDSDSMQKLANTSKELGARWKAMDQADKEAFQEKAERINEERNKTQVDTKVLKKSKNAAAKKEEKEKVETEATMKVNDEMKAVETKPGGDSGEAVAKAANIPDKDASAN